jgi:putative transposase
MITYKADQAGIQVILTEESFTSKASFLDHEILPTYEEGKEYSFSWKRVYHGL